MANVRLGDIRYNQQTAAFEARVDVQRGDTIFRYPCQVQGPESTPPEIIGTALARAALSMSDTSTWTDT